MKSCGIVSYGRFVNRPLRVTDIFPAHIQSLQEGGSRTARTESGEMLSPLFTEPYWT